MRTGNIRYLSNYEDHIVDGGDKITNHVEEKTLEEVTKIVFLDCDGVVSPFTGIIFSPIHMKRLKSIIDASGAKIVLSSSWRSTEFGRKEVMTQLAKNNIAGYISCTPELINRTRAYEIIEWIKLHGKKLNVVNFVALDDINLAATAPDKAFFSKHSIVTDSLKGLTDKDVKRAIDILKDENNIGNSLYHEVNFSETKERKKRT